MDAGASCVMSSRTFERYMIGAWAKRRKNQVDKPAARMNLRSNLLRRPTRILRRFRIQGQGRTADQARAETSTGS